MTARAFMIANQWRQGSAQPFTSIDPADGSIAAEICSAGRADVDDAVAAARAALQNKAWSGLSGTNGRDFSIALAILLKSGSMCSPAPRCGTTAKL